jgi:hypothetical protein
MMVFMLCGMVIIPMVVIVLIGVTISLMMMGMIRGMRLVRRVTGKRRTGTGKD